MPNLMHVRTHLFHRPKFNKIIVLLTLSDVFSWGIYIIIMAITGIYLAQKIDQDVVQIVGVGTAVYMATRGMAQLPIGKMLDKWKFDNDEIIALTVGNILMGSTYLFYPLITTAGFYFTLQFIFAIGAALNLVAWRKLFAQNLDKHSEGVEYGEYGFVMGLSTAVFGITAGYIANQGMQYFNMVIVVMGIIIMLSSIFPILIFKVKKRKSSIW